MKKYICLLALIFMISGCGLIERGYENANYESLTNEKGTIELYSGGVLLKTYVDAKIIYSSSDSMGLWFETKDGKNKYWQGEMEIAFK